MRVDNPSELATMFSVFSTIRGKTMTKPFQALLLRGNTIAIVTAYAPGPHMWPIPDPTSIAPNQWKSDVYVKN